MSQRGLGHLQCPCRPKGATYKTTEHISGAHELGRLQRPCRPEDATYMRPTWAILLLSLVFLVRLLCWHDIKRLLTHLTAALCCGTVWLKVFMSLSLSLAAEPHILLILVAVAFIAGFIDAIAGGGGLLTIPALLMAGLPPHLVLGTNKLCATFGSATASLAFYRKGLFKPKQWQRCLWATGIGAILGAILAQQLPSQWLNQMLPVVVFACALYLLFGRMPEEHKEAQPMIKTTRQWPQGLTLGFYDGVAGPGTGAFWTVSTMLLYPLDLLRASGVARSMNFVSNGAALSMFIISGNVAWAIGLGMGVALMLGATVGARVAIGGGNKLIRPVFILVVMALAARLAWQHWFGVTGA